MRYIIAIAIAIFSMWMCFSTANHVIHWITAGISEPSVHAAMVIFLWVIAFSTVLSLSIWIGLGVATGLIMLLGGKK